MIYEIAVSQQAEADVRGIYEYISFALLAPHTAASQIDRIEKAIADLRRMPQRFQAYDKEPWRCRRLKVLSIPCHRIILA